MTEEQQERIEEIEGWQVTLSPWYSHADNHQTTVSIDDAYPYLEVNAEQGSGYLQQNIRTHVPLPVLFRLLEQAGYRVERVQSSNQK